MTPTLTIHVLSDSLGETGETVARAVSAQFDPNAFRIERLPKVSTPEELRASVSAHCGTDGIFFYTFVNDALRAEMGALVESGVNAVDLLGPAVALLRTVSGFESTGEAGAIRRTDQDYFDRIDAMDFAVRHDDGRNVEGLPEADIVLVGVSRTSKTPLSMYLAFKGYRVANVPLAPGMAPPGELYELDPRRVFGLTTSADILLEIRSACMRELGGWVPGYADREAIEVELEEARAVMRHIGCIVVRTDDRAIEEIAREITSHLEGYETPD